MSYFVTLVHRQVRDMGKSAEKPKSLRGVLLRLGVGALVVYLVFSFISGQMKVADKRRQLAELNERVTLQAEQNRELERLMEADEEKAYVERMAREKLGYAWPTERVFIDLTGE